MGSLGEYLIGSVRVTSFKVLAPEEDKVLLAFFSVSDEVDILL